MAKQSVRYLMVVAALGWLPSVALADEVVHFTNGAEMTVRSHAVEKQMVKLDLGGNSFISFPMSMVDKIVSAGHDVFLNPSFHPANQAVAGAGTPGVAGTPSTGSIIADTTIRNGGGSVGFTPQPNAKGGAGVMLGEAADALPQGVKTNSLLDQTVAGHRRAYNPAFPTVPGGPPQVITPAGAPKGPQRMTLVVPRVPQETPPPPPPADTNVPDNPPGDADPEDPPDTP